MMQAADARREGAAAVVKMEDVLPAAPQQVREEERRQKQEEAPKQRQQPDIEKSLLQKEQKEKVERQQAREKLQLKHQEEMLLQQPEEEALQRQQEEKLQQQREKATPQHEDKLLRQQCERTVEQQQPKEDGVAKQGSRKEAEALPPIGTNSQKNQSKESVKTAECTAVASSARKLVESVKGAEKPEPKTKEKAEEKVAEKRPEKVEETQRPEKQTFHGSIPGSALYSPPVPSRSYNLRSKPWPSQDVLVQRMSPSAQRLMEEHTAMMIQQENVWLPPRKRATASANSSPFLYCANNSKALHYLGLCCCCQSCQADMLPERRTSAQIPVAAAPAPRAMPSQARAGHAQSHSPKLQMPLEMVPEQQQQPELQTGESIEKQQQQGVATLTEPSSQMSFESYQAGFGKRLWPSQGYSDEYKKWLMGPDQPYNAVEGRTSVEGSPQTAAEAHSQGYSAGHQCAQGYYDETGKWVQGYYDEAGRWVQGYYDETGRWVQGYYDETGNWVQGYYDETGKWVYPPAVQQTQ